MRVSVAASTRLLSAVGPLLLTLVLAAGVLVLRAMDRPVKVVRVQAELSETERQQVRGAIDGLVGQGMLTLDLDEVVATMRELSWPRLVSVRRDWPDGLVLTLVKETFVARWGEHGALNSAGEVFDDVALGTALPVLRADAGPRRAMQTFQLLQGVAGPSGASIDALEQNAAGEWTVELDDGFRVALGRDELAPRLGRFLTVHRRVLRGLSEQVAWVDARYGNGVAVKWRGADRASALAQAH